MHSSSDRDQQSSSPPKPAHGARRRSRSPRLRTSHSRRSRHRLPSNEAKAIRDGKQTRKQLPLNSKELKKDDYSRYKPLFALYLELHKSLVLTSISSDEAWGRWKSFVKRWNDGQLAEGWYDPQRLKTATDDALSLPLPQERTAIVQPLQLSSVTSDSDDNPGPSLPPRSQARAGPNVPSRDDLRLRQELEAEEADERRSELRRERRAEHALAKERLDELAPRAAAGTKERQIEKRRQVADSNRAFAAAKEGGDLPDVPDQDLMGEGEDGLQVYKRHKQELERKKTEKEQRREDIAQARKAEREDRVRQFQEREAKTMQGLMDLARQRFG